MNKWDTMDWLTAGAAAASIIGVIFAVFFQFQQSKKKKTPPTPVREPRANITIRNLNLYMDGYPKEENQHPVARDVQARAGIDVAQESSSQVTTLTESLHKYRVSTQTDSLSQPPHTNQAEQDLSKILLFRSFHPPRAQQKIQDLWYRISDRGDLCAASSSIKIQILFWAHDCAQPTPNARPRQTTTK